MSVSAGVQTQLEISSTLLLTKNAVFALLRASSEDDVQAQAVLALEQLGASILGHISQDRIEEGIAALTKVEYWPLKRLKLSIGLHGGGVAEVMRNSVPCIAGFLLAVACKTVFTDGQTAQLLYHMMEDRKILKTVPVTKGQIEQVIGIISGYGHKITPSTVFQDISKSVLENHVRPGTGVQPAFFQTAAPGTIARILSGVFEALQNDEIERVSLDGALGGVWLASVFLWLLPTKTEVISEGVRIKGCAGSRVSVRLTNNAVWTIQEWRSEDHISVVVVEDHAQEPDPFRNVYFNHTPIGSARDFISVQYGCTNEDIREVGHLAAAIVDVAFEYGQVRSEQGYALDAHCNPSDRNGLTPAMVPLREISQEQFLGNYHSIMRLFGFHVDDSFREAQATLYTALSRMVSERLFLNTWSAEQRVFYAVRNETDGIKLISRSTLIEPAVHLATEALYFCFCEKLPEKMFFRNCTRARYYKNCSLLWGLIFLPNDPKAGDIAICPDSPAKMKSLRLSELRTEAFHALLPGLADISPSDLAISNNGYVAFTTALGCPTTERRQCTAISVIPGALRYRVDKSYYHKIFEAPHNPDKYNLQRLFFATSEMPVDAFQGSHYLGVEARPDAEEIEVQYLLAPQARVLHLETYFSFPSSMETPPVEVSWKNSIECLSFAEHISEHDLTPVGEELLARAWRDQGLLQCIAWRKIAESLKADHKRNYVTMTSGNESLRFFEAGRWIDPDAPSNNGLSTRRILIRHTAPLIQCIKRAVAVAGENRPWVTIG